MLYTSEFHKITRESWDACKNAYSSIQFLFSFNTYQNSNNNNWKIATVHLDLCGKLI